MQEGTLEERHLMHYVKIKAFPLQWGLFRSHLDLQDTVSQFLFPHSFGKLPWELFSSLKPFLTGFLGSVDALQSWLTEFLQPVPSHSGFCLFLLQAISLCLFKSTGSIPRSWISLSILLSVDLFWFIINLAFLNPTITLEDTFSYRKISTTHSV